MSVVTGVMLITSTCDRHLIEEAVNPFICAERHNEWSNLVDVAEYSGGTKHPQYAAGAAGINYALSLVEKLPAFLATLDWSYPENVVLILQPEEGRTVVWRPGEPDPFAGES